MKHAKVQSLRSLREEMKAVARGERPAPAEASKPSFNSVEAVVRLLTPDNRRLLALIRDREPRSVAELVSMTGRAQPNLTRTLAKFEAAGFITMKTVGRRKAPSVAVQKDRRRDRSVFRSGPTPRGVVVLTVPTAVMAIVSAAVGFRRELEDRRIPSSTESSSFATSSAR